MAAAGALDDQPGPLELPAERLDVLVHAPRIRAGCEGRIPGPAGKAVNNMRAGPARSILRFA
jgi:hypothetical protein